MVIPEYTNISDNYYPSKQSAIQFPKAEDVPFN